MRIIIPVLLFAFQLGAIVYARFVPTRYFCWAPYDMQTDYRLEVTVNDARLSSTQIQQRYRRAASGIDNRSTQHLIDIIEQTEQRYHAGDRTEVLMTYSV